MHNSLRLLKEALQIAKREEQALLDGDTEQLESLVDERMNLQNKAWDLREGCNESELLEVLKQLHEIQKKLEELAKKLSFEINQQITNTKTQKKYFLPYGNKRPGANIPSLLFSKLS